MGPLFDVGPGQALRWLCDCIGYSAGGARGHIVGPQASRCIGRWPLRGSSGCARCDRGTIFDMVPWGHIVPAWAVVGVIRMVGATLEASAAVAVTRVL